MDTPTTDELESTISKSLQQFYQISANWTTDLDVAQHELENCYWKFTQAELQAKVNAYEIQFTNLYEEAIQLKGNHSGAHDAINETIRCMQSKLNDFQSFIKCTEIDAIASGADTLLNYECPLPAGLNEQHLSFTGVDVALAKLCDQFPAADISQIRALLETVIESTQCTATDFLVDNVSVLLLESSLLLYGNSDACLDGPREQAIDFTINSLNHNYLDSELIELVVPEFGDENRSTAIIGNEAEIPDIWLTPRSSPLLSRTVNDLENITLTSENVDDAEHAELLPTASIISPTSIQNDSIPNAQQPLTDIQPMSSIYGAYERNPLDANDRKYGEVLQAIFGNRQTANKQQDIKIHEVFEIHNEDLRNSFKAKQIAVQKLLQNTATTVTRMLFHGTDHSTVHRICLEGFNRSFCGKNAVKFGEGCYFAMDFAYSQHYSTPRPKDKHQFMFLCEVVTGEYCQGYEGLKVLPIKQGFEHRYHSAVNNLKDPKLFIVFNDATAYPTYLIEFIVQT